MKDRKSSVRDDKLTQVANPRKPANLGRDIQAKIGEQLRAMYGDVVDQGVPDRFLDLLNRIDTPRKGGDPETSE